MTTPATPAGGSGQQDKTKDFAAQVTNQSAGLAWLSIPVTQRPPAKPGPKGMRLRDVETEETMAVPDVWPYLNDTPRGSIPMKGPVPAAGYSIFDKVQVWSENCIDLYEDAIYDRWSSANSIPWAEIEALPEVIEGAIDQICTEFSEHAYLDVQIISHWLERISYGFKETKNFLATYVFDRGRHTEAFRKRALANGGGLGIEGPGIYHRAILGALRFNDLSTAMLLRALWTKTVCEAIAERPRTEVDRQLFSLVARDCGRHIAYHFGLIEYGLSKEPEKAPDYHFSLVRHELQWVAEWNRDQSFTEALAITLGNNAEEGLRRVEEVRARFVRALKDGLDGAGLKGHEERMHPKMKEYLGEAVAAS